MKYIKFNILDDYSDIIKHGITERGIDFMHADYNSDTFKNSKNTLAKELNVMERDLFFINQVHDKNIKNVGQIIINDTNCADI